MFGGIVSKIPSGWLLCDGTSYSTSTYPDLYNVITNNFGGDSSNFNVPDLRARFPLGVGSTTNNNYSLAADGGEEYHTLTVPEMPLHAHGLTNNGASYTPGGYVSSVQAYYNGDSGNTSYVGGGLPHNNMPPYVPLNFIIKF
jgi:hypothetical protein